MVNHLKRILSLLRKPLVTASNLPKWHVTPIRWTASETNALVFGWTLYRRMCCIRYSCICSCIRHRLWWSNSGIRSDTELQTFSCQSVTWDRLLCLVREVAWESNMRLRSFEDRRNGNPFQQWHGPSYFLRKPYCHHTSLNIDRRLQSQWLAMSFLHRQ